MMVVMVNKPDAEEVVDGTAERLLLDYARWLTDRDSARLGSIEQRGGSIVGWGGTQVAISLGVLAVVKSLPDNAWRSLGMAALVVAVSALAAAMLTTILGVTRARSLPAPRTDLADTRSQLAGHPADAKARERDLATQLVGALLDPKDDKPAVLPGLTNAVNRRARWLRFATYGLAVAVVLDVLAAVFLAVSATVP